MASIRFDGVTKRFKDGQRLAFHASASALHVFDAATGEALGAPQHAASAA